MATAGSKTTDIDVADVEAPIQNQFSTLSLRIVLSPRGGANTNDSLLAVKNSSSAATQ